MADEEDIIVQTEDGEQEGESPVNPDDEQPKKKKFDFKGFLHNFWEKLRTFPHNAYQWLHDWMCGTEDHPLPTYSLRAKFRRWFLIRYRGYVYCIFTQYDRQEQEYIIEREIIPRKRLSRYAVPVTNEKYTYHHDLNNEKRGFSTEADAGFTAVDAYLYMKCNKIEEAMRINLDRTSNFDANKLIMLAVVGAGIVVGIYVYMMQ